VFTKDAISTGGVQEVLNKLGTYASVEKELGIRD
jgi:hypothetical protein